MPTVVIGVPLGLCVGRWPTCEGGCGCRAQLQIGWYSGFIRHRIGFDRPVTQENVSEPMSLNKEWMLKTTSAWWRWRTWRGLT